MNYMSVKREGFYRIDGGMKKCMVMQVSILTIVC